jgi:acyl-CoA synthetase (NDP forming)
MRELIETVQKVRKEGRTLLTEVESKKLLEEAGLPIMETEMAKAKEEALSVARKLGFPVVLKVVSPEIVHKSDSGGVKLGLSNENEVASAYDEIMAVVKKKNPEATVLGVSVQKMAQPGVEVIVGMSKDAQFGPVLMFGLGGIFVEVLRDVSFRIVPITRRDARQMIEEIRGFPLLQGYRGQEPADIRALEDVLLKLSDFVEKNPEIKEIDMNPIFAYSNGALAVDARVILEGG